MTTTTEKKKEGTGQFFFKMDQSLSSKNKMDEDIHDFLWSIDGTLIGSPQDLDFFKDFLENKVKEIHTKHPRCKAMELRIWSFGFDTRRGIKDMSVACGCSTGKIYQVNQNYMHP